MTYFKPLAVLALVSSCSAQPAMAQMLCGPNSEIVDVIEGSFMQAAQSWGFTERGEIIQTYADDRGNWTMIVTRQDGVSCVIGAGYAYTIEPQGELL